MVNFTVRIGIDWLGTWQNQQSDQYIQPKLRHCSCRPIGVLHLTQRLAYDKTFFHTYNISLARLGLFKSTWSMQYCLFHQNVTQFHAWSTLIYINAKADSKWLHLMLIKCWQQTLEIDQIILLDKMWQMKIRHLGMKNA